MGIKFLKSGVFRRYGTMRPDSGILSAGFTLLEILVAVVILSGGLTLVIRASHGTLGALGRARESIYAGLILRERLDRIRWESSRGIVPVSGSGSFTGPYGDYGWTATAGALPGSMVPGDAGQAGILDAITVEVRRTGGLPIRAVTALRFRVLEAE